MKHILVFDVNETLLDLKALDPIFEKTFGDSSVRKQWFSQFIHNAFVSIITDTYQPFGVIGLAALDMVAAQRGIKLKNEDKSHIVNGIKTLPPHLEVLQSLKRLKDAGFRMVTLTNSTEEVAKAQITNAGLQNNFEHIFSADSVKRLKPAKEAYLHVSQKLKVQTKNLMLIAAHAWDIAGAINVGYSAAFIARPGAVLNPLVPKPEIIVKNLNELVDKLVGVKT